MDWVSIGNLRPNDTSCRFKEHTSRKLFTETKEISETAVEKWSLMTAVVQSSGTNTSRSTHEHHIKEEGTVVTYVYL